MTERSTSTALALPEDIRKELLKAQGESIGDMQSLPQIRVMGQGVGLFEYKDTNDTTKTFRGIILGAHAQNVLWDRDANEEAATDELKRPACNSPDGKTGIPRVGFEHFMLGRPAEEGDRIDCGECKYNRFGSGDMLISGKNPKGKAVTNQKMVYVLVEGRETPMELVLNAMSLKNYDKYATTLLNSGIPTQAILTTFAQTVTQKSPTVKYGVVTFERGESLTMEQFEAAVAKRREYMKFIAPVVEEFVDVDAEDAGVSGVPDENADASWLDENS